MREAYRAVSSRAKLKPTFDAAMAVVEKYGFPKCSKSQLFNAAVLPFAELLAEADKSKLVITYASGEKTQALVKEILSMPEEAKESLAFLVRKKGK